MHYLAAAVEALPVIVKEMPQPDQVLRMSESGWVAIGAIVSALVAIATGLLAFYTWKLAAKTTALADETMVGIRQADEHHQQSLMPYLVVKNLQVTLDQNPGTVAIFAVSGQIINTGVGPAVDVRIIPERVHFFENLMTLEEAPLAANGNRLIQRNVQAQMFQPSSIPHYPHARITFEYFNIFGQMGRVVFEAPGGGAHLNEISRENPTIVYR